MTINLEIWDSRSGDILAIFATQQEIINYIASRIERKGSSWLDTKMLVLESDDLDQPHVISQGVDILPSVSDDGLTRLLAESPSPDILIERLPHLAIRR